MTAYHYIIDLRLHMRWMFLIMLVAMGVALNNGLGLTPPMGWNSWNKYACNINEKLVKQTADLLVSLGLAAKGYVYVNIDDCWQLTRNSTTNEIIEDRTKFPSGMAALGEYIHSKGLFFGLYSDAGYKTCQGGPGSLFMEDIDAKTYAEWKVDYLKYDNCYTDDSSTKIRYPFMRDALNATGRPIYFSMCSWGVQQPWQWADDVGNSWRTAGDISGYYQSMLDILDKQVGLAQYAHPGGWNDPDMLQVGNGLMTNDQYQSHFALWAALKAPLLIGCGLTGITQQTLTILSNEEVIAVNQDPLGIQADLILQEKDATAHRQVWGGQLSNDRFVLVCFNRHDTETTFSLNFTLLIPQRKVTNIREIIDHIDLMVPQKEIFITKKVRSHYIAMYVLQYQQL